MWWEEEQGTAACGVSTAKQEAPFSTFFFPTDCWKVLREPLGRALGEMLGKGCRSYCIPFKEEERCFFMCWVIYRKLVKALYIPRETQGQVQLSNELME